MKGFIRQSESESGSITKLSSLSIYRDDKGRKINLVYRISYPFGIDAQLRASIELSALNMSDEH